MPRKKPIQPPVYAKKSEFTFHKNYDFSSSKPCLNKKCNGFMFLTILMKDNSKPCDVLECFVCKKTKKLGNHLPNRKV
jgi:hypothetical protein